MFRSENVCIHSLCITLAALLQFFHEINIPLYLLQFFDQCQTCDVHANLQTANVIGKLTTNLGNTLIEKYSEIGNTGIFL